MTTDGWEPRENISASNRTVCLLVFSSSHFVLFCFFQLRIRFMWFNFSLLGELFLITKIKIIGFFFSSCFLRWHRRRFRLKFCPLKKPVVSVADHWLFLTFNCCSQTTRNCILKNKSKSFPSHLIETETVLGANLRPKFIRCANHKWEINRKSSRNAKKKKHRMNVVLSGKWIIFRIEFGCQTKHHENRKCEFNHFACSR